MLSKQKTCVEKEQIDVKPEIQKELKTKIDKCFRVVSNNPWKSEATRKQSSWRSKGSKKELKGTQAWPKH